MGLARWWAVRRYLAVLPRQMFKDYGHTGPYTAAQVMRSAERSRLSDRFIPYAVAIFCQRDAAEAMWPQFKGYKDLGAVRSDIAGQYFAGNTDFSVADVAACAASHGFHSGHGDSGGHCGFDGGHHGGDFGGGHHH